MLLQENVDIAEFLNTKNLCAYLFILFIFGGALGVGGMGWNLKNPSSRRRCC
jgi:hypothetical protein